MPALSVLKKAGWPSRYCDKAAWWITKESRFDSKQVQRIFPSPKYEDCDAHPAYYLVGISVTSTWMKHPG